MGSVAHGTTKRWLLMANLRPLLASWLYLMGNAHHHLDGFHRVLTIRCFFTEHHRISPIQNRIGHVARFSSCGPRLRHHRFQHLRGSNDEKPELISPSNDLLLHEWNLLKRQLHAQITSGNHYPISHSENRI